MLYSCTHVATVGNKGLTWITLHKSTLYLLVYFLTYLQVVSVVSREFVYRCSSRKTGVLRDCWLC